MSCDFLMPLPCPRCAALPDIQRSEQGIALTHWCFNGVPATKADTADVISTLPQGSMRLAVAAWNEAIPSLAVIGAEKSDAVRNFPLASDGA
jgi:hypothetical protein